MAAASLLAGCADGDGSAGEVDLDAPLAPVPDEPDGDEPSPDEEEDGEAQDGDDGDGAEPDPDVALATARHGTWEVGFAGSVTFDIDDGELVLEDVTEAEGWTATVEKEDRRKLEVDFDQGDEHWEFHAELKDEQLEIEVRLEAEDVEPSSFTLGAVGELVVEVEDDRLVLVDLTLGDGWAVAEREEKEDELTLVLRGGAATYEVELELEDDGLLDVTLDYRVTGPV